jgi:WD40 repeat protein
MTRKLMHVCFLIVVIFIGATIAQTSPFVIWSQQHGSGFSTRSAVTFSPDGSLLASGRVNTRDVDLWNANNGNLVRILSARDNEANDLAFSPDGQYLATATGGAGKTLNLNLWRVADGVRVVGRVPAFSNGAIGVAFSPDGHLLVACGFQARFIKLFRVPDLVLVATYDNFDPDFGRSQRVNAVAFSPDGQFIGLGDTRGVKLRRTSDGTLVRSFGAGSADLFIHSIAFSPDGQRIAAAVTNLDPTYATCVDCTIKLWDVADGALLHTYTNGAGVERAKVAFSPNGKLIGAGYTDAHTNLGAVQFWIVDSEVSLRRDAQPVYVQGFAFSPTGQTYAYLRADGQVGVASAPSLREMK